MKKLLYISVLGLCMILNVSCTDNNDTQSPSNNSLLIAAIKATVSTGTWRVTLFDDSGTDETAHFNGYSFTFGAGSVLTATDGVNTNTGVWSVTDSDSMDDSPEDVHFNIEFTTPVDFMDLTDDWEVISRTDTKIQLKDVSGGGGGTDYLTFEKN